MLASVAAQAPALGARTVVATSDRDSFALIDDNTRMLRILNGGVDASPLLDPDRLAMVTGVRPDQYLDLAALRGDASDNLPGVPGFGAKTAVKLLQALGSGQAAFDDAANGGERCRAAVGTARAKALATPEAKERWLFNREVMAMVTTAELGLDLGRRAAAGCRSTRTRSATTYSPLRAARRRRDPGAHPPRAHPHRHRALRRPALEGRAAAAGRAAAQADPGAGGTGLRARGPVLRRLSRDRPAGTTHRRRGRHLQPAGAAPAPAASGWPRSPSSTRCSSSTTPRPTGPASGCAAQPVTAETLATNTGGAGGFNHGLAWAIGVAAPTWSG